MSVRRVQVRVARLQLLRRGPAQFGDRRPRLRFTLLPRAALPGRPRLLLLRRGPARVPPGHR